jgi:glycosyltransferase involved in cell wall biosynthesis
MNQAMQQPVNPVKIAFLFVSMPVGGAEDFLLSASKYLPLGIEARFVCLRNLGVLGEEARLAGLPIDVVPVFPTKRMNPLEMLRLAWWFREHGIQVVHAQSYHDQLFGVIAAKLAGIRSIVHQQKTFLELTGRKGFFMRHIYRWADHVIALSEETRRDLIAAFDLDPKEVSVVPNAIDPAVFRPVEDRVAVRSALGLDPKEFLAGSVASLHPTKNHQATIEAMALLAQRGTALPKFMLFGEGQDRPILEKGIEKNQLGENLILAGRKRPVAPWLQSLDLFVLPSHWEGQPLALLQALDCRIPILASRIEGNTALLSEEHPGLFKPTDHSTYADLLERAFTDEAFRQSLLEFQEKLPRPSLPKLSLQLAELYTRLAAKA